MNNKNLFLKVAITIITIATFNFNFVYGQGVSVISIHTDAYTPGGYEGGAHVIGSGTFANSLQSGLSTSADRFNIRKKLGVGTTAVNDANATLNVAKRAGVTNAALIEVGAHRLLLEKYGTPTGVANSPYVTDLIDNVIAPNVGSSGKIIIPMDHTRRRIPDTPGGNTYSNANATGAAEYNGHSERDVTDLIAAKIKAKFGDRVVIIKPEDYQSYQEYDAAITSAAGGAATDSTPTTDTSSASTTAGTVSYQSYTNFPGVGRISSLCQLITALWYLGFALLLTSVLGMFLYGGYIYVTAGVNAGKVNQAKEIFTNTITGLIIGLSIFIIINIINPGLLQGNCSIPSVGSGSTIGGPAGPSNIVPKPGESVFPVTYLYQGPSGGQVYGAPRDGRIHAGIDFTPCWADTTPGGVPYTRAGWEAQPVLAFRDGTVNESTTGYLGVTHADGVRTRYVHNSRNLVRVGDSVKAGQEIARVGKIDTAVAHLHFEVYINGSPVNPANILLDSSRNPDPSKVKTTGSPRSGCAGL